MAFGALSKRERFFNASERPTRRLKALVTSLAAFRVVRCNLFIKISEGVRLTLHLLGLLLDLKASTAYGQRAP